MTTQSLSLSLTLEELKELQKDRTAFVQAYDKIRGRLQASLNSSRPHPPLHKWSGARAVCGSLEMAISHLEQNIERYTEAVRMIHDGEILDSDADTEVRLGVVQGGDVE
jgi:hypothetical protein